MKVQEIDPDVNAEREGAEGRLELAESACRPTGGWPIVTALFGTVLLATLGLALRPVVSASPTELPPRRGEFAADLELLEATGRVFETVAEVVSPAVVYIESRLVDPKGKATSEESGSGVLVRSAGVDRSVVVTNLHVVQNARPQDIDIVLGDGRLLHPRRVLVDPDTDLAVLDPESGELPAARMGNSDKVRVGQWVVAIGSPFGLMQSVTHGIISARDRRQLGMPGDPRIKEFLQTDAAINPGSSGGPLVNLRGEVIGINSAIASHTGSSSGVGFSIPANLVRWVVDELLRHGQVRRAFLGVGFPLRFESDDARQLGLDVPRGAYVASVHPRSPADRAGILVGDVILYFEGVPIDDDHHLINLIGKTAIGSKAETIVWRDKARKQLVVELGGWEEFRVPPSTQITP